MRTSLTLLALATTLTAALAKTDLAGCTSTATVVEGAYSALWWVPETGEICQGIDCGGGRGPVKKDVPGCPAYTGSLDYAPSYIAGWGPDGKAEVAATTTKAAEDAEETGSGSGSGGQQSSTKLAQPVVTPGPGVAVSTADSGDVGMSIQTDSMVTSAPSGAMATGTGMVTSRVASSIVLDSASGNSTGGGNGTSEPPKTGAASQMKAVGVTFVGAVALVAAIAI